MNLLSIFKDTDDHIDFPAGAIIFEQGATGDFMYVIIAGEVELSLYDVSLGTASAGDIVGEMALLESNERSATAAAKTDCMLAPIDRHSFELLIRHTPKFALHVMNILADRLRQAHATIASVNSQPG